MGDGRDEFVMSPAYWEFDPTSLFFYMNIAAYFKAYFSTNGQEKTDLELNVIYMLELKLILLIFFFFWFRNLLLQIYCTYVDETCFEFQIDKQIKGKNGNQTVWPKAFQK